MADLPETLAGSPSEPSLNHHGNHQFKEKEETPPAPTPLSAHSQSPQPPAPASAPEPAPTDPIDQELVILDLYRQNIAPMPAPLTYDAIAADILDLDQAGQDPLKVFTYAITQAVGANVLRYNYIQTIVADIRDSKMTLAAYIQKRQAKTKQNGGPTNGTANRNGKTRTRKPQPVNIAGTFTN